MIGVFVMQDKNESTSSASPSKPVEISPQEDEKAKRVLRTLVVVIIIGLIIGFVAGWFAGGF
jgi:hypothetical protein